MGKIWYHHRIGEYMKYLLVFLFSFSLFAKETRIKIAVIDTGVSRFQEQYLCKGGKKSLVDDLGYDTNGHGTNIISILASGLDFSKYCIISYKVFSSYSYDGILAVAINEAIMDKVQYINLSAAGTGSSFSEKHAIEQTIKNGIYIFIAGGNDSKNLDKKCDVYPACYRFDSQYFKVIGATDTGTSNTGSFFYAYAKGRKQGFPPMTGTSQATPNALIFFITKVTPIQRPFMVDDIFHDQGGLF
jgi:hypothetical protein